MRRRSRRPRNTGRTRIKLAALLSKELNVEICPHDIWQNISPSCRLMDLARWGVDAKVPGQKFTVNVHSWDRMGDILKSGVAVVSRDSLGIEVCSR